MAFEIRYCNAKFITKTISNSSLNSHVYWDTLYIVKQNKKSSRISLKDFVDFQNFQKFYENRILMEA